MYIKKILSATFILILGAFLFYIAGNILFSTPALQFGADARLPDGSRYYGEVKDSLFHGKGTLVWETGDEYSGGFENGMFHGNGTLKFRGGDVYTGEFQSGFMQGNGKLTANSGTIYEGEFVKDDFTGKGIIKNSSVGYIYTGEVKNWHEHGTGIYKSSDDSTYSGEFVDGSFTGRGTYMDSKKNKYIGDFKDWTLEGKGRFEGVDGINYEGFFEDSEYKGKGKYTYANGDVFTGTFEYGLANGYGSLIFAKPKKGITEQSGQWKYGQFQDPEDKKRRLRSQTRAETLLYIERERLDKALSQIETGRNNKPDMFFIGVGGDGSQQVFKREVEFAADKIDQLYAISGHKIQLVNTYIEDTDHPLATRTSLRQSINSMSKKMDTDQDVLMLYITSHGSKKFKISLRQPGFNFPGLEANELKIMLDESDIKWKVIIISACYSGGYIDLLENENTLVITAAASKRKSFGCSDEAELTWFAKAFLRDSLQPGVSLRDAFNNAKILVTAWEKKEGYKKPSNPQISIGSNIEKYLASAFGKNAIDGVASNLQ